MKTRSTVAAAMLLASSGLLAPAAAAPHTPHPQAASTSMAFGAGVPAAGPSANARSAATAHLAAHSGDWGLAGTELAFDSVMPSESGTRTVRYTQTIEGVPVLGSVIALVLGVHDEALSLTAHTSTAPSATVRMTQAQVRALMTGRVGSLARIGHVSLAVADDSVFPTMSVGAHYVWEVSVTSRAVGAVITYLDDATGATITTLSRQRHVDPDSSALICDRAALAVKALAPCSTATAVSTVDDLSNPSDVELATEYQRVVGAIAATRSYFSTYLKLRASDTSYIDINSNEYLGNIAPDLNYGYVYGSDPAAGPTSTAACVTKVGDVFSYPYAGGVCTPRISVFLNTCSSVPTSFATCSYYKNAYWTTWDSAQCATGICGGAFIGHGLGVDDVVAHEITHGVTNSVFGAASLLRETDALSEMYSDLLGEAVDQMQVDAGEVADPLWSFGEDIGYSSTYTRTSAPWAGRIRTMSGVLPGEYRTIFSGWDPNGEAHYNSGPGNRFAWLIGHGGKQSGWAITALGTVPADGLCHQPEVECTGLIRTTQLFMQALPKLSTASTYFDFARAIITSCTELTTLAIPGFTTTSCRQVRNALSATRIWKVGFTSSLTRLAASPAGTSAVITARLVSSTGLPAKYVRVQLQVRKNRYGTWRTVATTTTSRTGYARFPVAFTTSRYYRVITKPLTTVPSASSVIRRATVY